MGSKNQEGSSFTSEPATLSLPNPLTLNLRPDSAGVYNVSLTVIPNRSDKDLVFYCPTINVAESGIENVVDDIDNAPTEYYNLNGMRINGDTLTPGLYIKRQGNKSEKVLVK